MRKFIMQKAASGALLGLALAAGCGSDTNMGQNPPPPQTVTVSATVQAAEIGVPDYAANTGSLTLKVDALGAFQLGGSLLLQYFIQPADTYVVTASDPGTLASSIDAAYQAGTETAISTAQLFVPAAMFAVTALPARRYLILAHSLKSAPTLRSYQVLSLSFTAP